MNLFSRAANWLESHWLVPSYGGGVLIAIALSFFAAALNTMAGWLYVISGTIFALLIIAGYFARRSLKKLEVKRSEISPVSAGDQLTIEIAIANPTPQPRTLLQAQDLLPFVLGKPEITGIEVIPPQGLHRWIYDYPTQKRGVYRWQEVQIRSGNPLGLFWCRRSWEVPTKAIVYPPVLPLTNCPIINSVGIEDDAEFERDQYQMAATEGVTKSLRPYRIGDPIRLVHWRSSAKLGEFQVRELEIFTGGQELIIALDSGTIWKQEIFEQGVIAAASLYFYALKQKMNVKLWTARTGLIQGKKSVLEALAATDTEEDTLSKLKGNSPLIWLTANPQSLQELPIASRWLLFAEANSGQKSPFPGIFVDLEETLQSQLQKPLR